MKKIQLKRGKEDSLLRYHPWVFSGAIAPESLVDEPGDGEMVSVYTSNGQFVAKGHYQYGSIAVRVLTFDDEAIDMDFWKRRLLSAYSVRKSIGVIRREQGEDENTTFRLVHGEGDNLPGLIIDCYGKTAVMQAHSLGMHECRREIAQALHEVTNGEIENIYYKSDTTLPFKSDIEKDNGFIDQRENRSLLERYAKNRSVLNMFCYTGGFSVYAMRGGAEIVHSVDSSAKAIELTNRNIELNFPDDGRHTAFCDDAFKFMDKNDGRYDLVVLDPPAFAKHRGALRNALKGYIRLNVKGLECIKSGGILFTFSCSQVVSKDQFRQAVFTAAAQAKRKVRILHQLHQPADHPINIYHPEGEYLKGLVLYVE